jgi:hypothetical protein
MIELSSAVPTKEADRSVHYGRCKCLSKRCKSGFYTGKSREITNIQLGHELALKRSGNSWLLTDFSGKRRIKLDGDNQQVRP